MPILYTINKQLTEVAQIILTSEEHYLQQVLWPIVEMILNARREVESLGG